MKVVVATDGSEASRNALEQAFDLSKNLRAAPEVHVVSVVDHIVPPGGLGRAPDGVPDLLMPDAEAALRSAEEIALREGVEIETHILSGHVAPQVMGFASELGADMIVLGTHGRRGIAKMLGSACQQIVRESPIPVLTIHSLS